MLIQFKKLINKYIKRLLNQNYKLTQKFIINQFNFKFFKVFFHLLISKSSSLSSNSNIVPTPAYIYLSFNSFSKNFFPVTPVQCEAATNSQLISFKNFAVYFNLSYEA